MLTSIVMGAVQKWKVGDGMTLEEAIKRYTSNAFYEKSDGNLQGYLEFNQLAEWLKDYKRLLEQETVSRESYEHEYFLRKEFEIKIAKLEQEPILDKIRAEIEELKPHSHYTQEMKNKVLEIIDKHRGES